MVNESALVGLNSLFLLLKAVNPASMSMRFQSVWIASGQNFPKAAPTALSPLTQDTEVEVAAKPKLLHRKLHGPVFEVCYWGQSGHPRTSARPPHERRDGSLILAKSDVASMVRSGGFSTHIVPPISPACCKNVTPSLNEASDLRDVSRTFRRARPE